MLRTPFGDIFETRLRRFGAGPASILGILGLPGIALAAAAVAGTQDTPVDLEEIDARAPALQVTGFGVGTYGYRSAEDDNSIAASKLAVSLFKRIGPTFSVFGQLTTLFEEAEGEDTEGHGSGGGELETEIDNLIFSFTPPGVPELSLAFGRFDAPIGFERDDEPLNLEPTRSFNFEFARPVKLTGAVLRYTPVPTWNLSLLAVNGWDTALDNNDAKTLGARVEFLPFEFGGIGITALYGAEKDENSSDQRLLVSGDFTLQPGRSLIVGAEGNAGREEGSAPDGGTANWAGGAVTLFYRVHRNAGVTFRYDYFEDPDGARTGVGQVLRSVTIAPMIFFRHAVAGIFSTIPRTRFALPAVALRLGIRFDRSTAPFFANRDEETHAVLEGIVIF